MVLLTGAVLIYGTLDMPDWGDPQSPASTHVSNYYIENADKDTATPNMVTAVLADYRGYDTMFETTVIFTAAIACFFLLRTFKSKSPGFFLYRHLPTGIILRIDTGHRMPKESKEFERMDSMWTPHDLIIKSACRMIIPFIQLFALYVIAHGHHSPGGGFQGGVILGASIILLAISRDLRTSVKRFTEKKAVFFCTAGIFIYAATGALCLFMGNNFLDYSALAPILGVDAVAARSYGILIVEIGVGMAVMAVMVSLYYILSSVGELDEGL